MRIYVSVDLEGIKNVDRFYEHEDKSTDYQPCKKNAGQLMYEEVKALYEGLVLKGSTEVIVFDSHAHSDTLSLSQDSPILTQVRRSRGNRVYFPSFDSSFDGIILWGYHVKAGSKDGRFGHTQTRRIMNVKINKKEVGEVYLHALYAFNKGVPLIAVSGDYGLKNEVENDIGNIPFFCTDLGDNSSREEYLQSIREFILNLNLDEVLKINQTLDWPTLTILEVTYKNAFVNIRRWLLRKQFRYAKLKKLSSCVYCEGSFIQQWDQFNGFLKIN